MAWLNVFLILILLGLAYLFWIRPILQKQPSLKEFYDVEGNLLAAISLKLAGLKQKLLAASSIIAIVAVQIYDTVLPQLTGVDVSKLTDKVPDWAWPVISIAFILLMNWFRTLADRRHEEVVAEIAKDSAVTMQAASKVVEQAVGTSQNSAMEAIVGKKIEIVESRP